MKNLLDVDFIIKEFLQKHIEGISTIHRIYFREEDSLSYRSFIEELTDELRTGCVSFINKNSDNKEELNSYLFYIVNAFAKRETSVKKHTEYLCPGCLFVGKDTPISLVSKIFKCEECESSLAGEKAPAKIYFYKTFYRHYKNGYRCTDCKRFIPHPMDNSFTISCPYTDCCFVGNLDDLRKMNHPTTYSTMELSVIDSDDTGFKNTLVSSNDNQLSLLESQEEFESKISAIKEVIDIQKNYVPYSGSESTAKHKYLIYEAFENLLNKFPLEMSGYLLDNSRSGGFQHKVFQEYIKLLESALPYSFTVNKKRINVSSLLDDNLSLFDGISNFEAYISGGNIIKNETQEFYIGGRKGSISRRYYIGKLLNIIDVSSKESLLSNVEEYSFNKIKLKNAKPYTKVLVSHLRVPPHYQMGGMSYLNRVRKKIVDKTNLLLSKSDE